MGCAVPTLISSGPSYHFSNVVLLFVTFSPPNPVTPSSQMEPHAYPTRRSTWRYIRVESGLALIPLVTRPLPSPQKAGLMDYAVPPLISPGPSHHFSDMGLLSVTLGTAQDKCPIIHFGSLLCQSLLHLRQFLWRK